jgi:hypothetical protein
MVPAIVHQYVLEALQAAAGSAITSIRFNTVGGGSINDPVIAFLPRSILQLTILLYLYVNNKDWMFWPLPN